MDHDILNHQQLDCLYNKFNENIIAQYYWPFVREITGLWPVISLTKGQQRSQVDSPYKRTSDWVHQWIPLTKGQ